MIGRLGKDAETKFTPSGISISKFTLATNRSTKDQQSGEWKELTDWHNIVVWRTSTSPISCSKVSKSTWKAVWKLAVTRTRKGRKSTSPKSSATLRTGLARRRPRRQSPGSPWRLRPAQSPCRVPHSVRPAASPLPARGFPSGGHHRRRCTLLARNEARERHRDPHPSTGARSCAARDAAAASPWPGPAGFPPSPLTETGAGSSIAFSRSRLAIAASSCGDFLMQLSY